MNTYGRVEVYLHATLTSVLDGGECSASRYDRFSPGRRRPRYAFDMWLAVPQNRSIRGGKYPHYFRPNFLTIVTVNTPVRRTVS